MTDATAATQDDVLAAITEMLSVVIGEDELLMVDEVTMATSFNDDLELESIEFVALAEELTNRYGERVDFVGWIADMELDALVTMTVGELVDYVAGSLAATEGASPAS
jgi:acyl carrier protein